MQNTVVELSLQPDRHFGQNEVMQKARDIGKYWLFEGVDQELLDRVTARLIPKKYANKEYLYHAGDKTQGIFLIETGKVVFSIPDIMGKDHFIDIASDVHCFGEQEVLGGFRHYASSYALGDCSAWLLPTNDFLSITENNTRVYKNIAKTNAHFMRYFHMSHYEAQKKSLEYRLINTLMILLARFGEDCQEGTRINMHLPHEELAFMVNASRQAVNKTLNSWEKQNWITKKYGHFVILDKMALEALKNRCA